MMVLMGHELWAQPAGGVFGGQRRFPRYGSTNGVAGTQPRFGNPNNPNGAPVNPAGLPGGPGGPGGPGNPGGPGAPGTPGGPPLSSSYQASTAFASQPEEMVGKGEIDFQGVDVSEVLDIYAKLVNRTLLRGALPQAQIILNTQTPLTKSEAIQALQAVLALNGISLVNIGDKFVKVIPSDQAGSSGGEIDRSGSSTNLPDLGTYVTHVVQLKYIKPSEMVQVIQPFSKLANSILPIDDNGILVLRDYAENVKRMMEMIEQVDVSVPAEYISDVIPIRYAKVDDIASALTALGGGGGATVSVGAGQGSSQISGLSGRGGSSFGGGGGGGGFGGTGGINGLGGGGGIGGGGIGGGGIGGGGAYGGSSSYGGSRTTPNGTPSGGASSFQQRLASIIGSPGGGRSEERRVGKECTW